MNICIVTNLYPPYYVGGFEVRCSQVAQALAERGHRVTVLTSHHGLSEVCVENGNPQVHRILDLYRPFAMPETTETIPFHPNRWFRWAVTRRNYKTTKKVLTRLRPDIVFVWSQSRLSLGSVRAAQNLGLPIAWTIGDPNLNQYRPELSKRWFRHALYYVLDRTILKNTTWLDLDFRHVHSISKDLKRRLINIGLPVESACVIYRGIPVQKFPPRPEPGLLHHPARVLFVGQLHPWKGVHTLLEAANRLLDEMGPSYLTVTVAGEGEISFKRELEEIAKRGSLCVSFLGMVPHDQLPEVYRDHDIFVFPSTGAASEGFGVTHLEAMASGVPVIGTVLGGQAELLVDGENALVFEAEDSTALSQSIKRLIEDDELRTRLAMTARALVERHYSIEAYIEKMETFLERARTHRS